MIDVVILIDSVLRGSQANILFVITGIINVFTFSFYFASKFVFAPREFKIYYSIYVFLILCFPVTTFYVPTLLYLFFAL